MPAAVKAWQSITLEETLSFVMILHPSTSSLPAKEDFNGYFGWFNYI